MTKKAGAAPVKKTAPKKTPVNKTAPKVNTSAQKKPKEAPAAPETKPLTRRNAAFVAEYLKCRNATQAAIRAGYSPDTAKQQGSRLLTNAAIRALIDQGHNELIEQVKQETGISLERTLREIARIGYFDPRKLFDAKGEPLPITELDDDTAAVIAGLDVLEEWEGSGEDRRLVGYVKKWKLADKKGALDMLMKHLGGYKVDNEQKVDPIASLLARVGGKSAIPVQK